MTISIKILLMFGLSALLSGCDDPAFGYGIGKKQLDGHSYIVYIRPHGCAILHDVDCSKCSHKQSRNKTYGY